MFDGVCVLTINNEQYVNNMSIYSFKTVVQCVGHISYDFIHDTYYAI